MRLAIVVISIFTALASFPAAQGKLDPKLAPETWPGRMPQEERNKLRPLLEQLLQAMRKHDDEKIRAVREEITKQMGKYAGAPEDPPEYGKPIDASTPDFAKVEAPWAKSFKRMQGRNGWEQAERAKAQGQLQPRLRVSFRNARAYLQAYEAGLNNKDEYLKYAIRGFDYIASTQASTGAFGFPYSPNATEGPLAQAARLVKEGEARGVKMREGDWVIEDLEDGGLQFDHGESGLGLLHAYAITGDKRYLEAARRAGDWAIKRLIVRNFNYNGFSGELLARLYLVTGEKRYLDAAIEKMRYGALPGQLANGRWVDQHNASIQYHSLMMSQLIELYLALKKANHPYANELKQRIVLGLDNLAGQITGYGAVHPKAHEMLCLDALARGLMVFGPRENWEKAANINVNYLCDHYLPELEKRGAPMAETVALYLLYRRAKGGQARSCEIEIEECLATLKPQPLKQATDKPEPGDRPTSPETQARMRDLRQELQAAMLAKDKARIYAVVSRIEQALGAYAGAPEDPERYVLPIVTDRPTSLRQDFENIFKTEVKTRGSKSEIAQKNQMELREAAYIALGCLRAAEAGLPESKAYQSRAREELDYLISRQQPEGFFAYPAQPGGNAPPNVRAMVERYVKEFPQSARDGFIVLPPPDGGFQFDTGVCGVALVEGYEALREARYLNAAKQAAAWAMAQNIAPNWNYNSFSVWLLARVFGATGEQKYLESAVQKARLGMLPGQMTGGRWPGPWMDQHNAKRTYHWIMARALNALLRVLPKGSRDYEFIRQRTFQAADCRAEDALRDGASASESAAVALSELLEQFGPNEKWDRALNAEINALRQTKNNNLYALGAYLRYAEKKNK